jgi:hypothetical protein
VLEGVHVAACFERLKERLPGLVDACDFMAHVDAAVTVDDFRNTPPWRIATLPA